MKKKTLLSKIVLILFFICQVVYSNSIFDKLDNINDVLLHPATQSIGHPVPLKIKEFTKNGDLKIYFTAWENRFYNVYFSVDGGKTWRVKWTQLTATKGQKGTVKELTFFTKARLNRLFRVVWVPKGQLN